MTLTKRDIARAIHVVEPTLSVHEAVRLVDTMLELIKAHLAAGDKVMITNFGTFETVYRAGRRGINPATGQSMTIPAHRAVTFRPAPAVYDRVDEGLDTEQQAPRVPEGVLPRR